MDSLEEKMVKAGEWWTKHFGSASDQNAFAIMNKWNRLKDDMQDGRLIPNYGERHADNLARAGAGIEIGQKAAKLIAEGKQDEADKLIESCLSLSSKREVADTSRKIIHGKNIKETIDDAKKDQANIKRAIELGKKYPNADLYQLLSQLNLETNQFQKGYDNGYAKLIKEHYKLGQKNAPILTDEQGTAINKLIKQDKACSSFGEAYSYVQKAEKLLANNKAKDFSQALAQVKDTEATRKEMQNQLAQAKVKPKAAAIISQAQGFRGAQESHSQKETVQPENGQYVKPLPEEKKIDWTKPLWKNNGNDGH